MAKNILIDINLSGILNLKEYLGVGSARIDYETERLLHISHTGRDNDTSNIFVGYKSGNGSDLGTENVGVGIGALTSLNSASQNTSIGAYSGANIIDGISNVIIGRYSAYSLTSGLYNTIIGTGADAKGPLDSHEIAIGDGVVGNGSNTTTIGTDGVQTDHYIAGDSHLERNQALNVSHQELSADGVISAHAMIIYISGGLNFTLPPWEQGRLYHVFDITGSRSSGITFSTSGSDTINGGTSATLGIGGAAVIHAKDDMGSYGNWILFTIK